MEIVCLEWAVLEIFGKLEKRTGSFTISMTSSPGAFSEAAKGHCAVVGEQQRLKMGSSPLQDISVSQTSGSRPIRKDSVINLDHGDPTMFEAFWQKTGDEATLVIPGWQTMSYFSDVTNRCWFLEPEFDKEVRRLHKLVGNAVVEDSYIVVGNGSTQLFQAALYALSPSVRPTPMSVVSAVPYYSSYPMKADYLRSGLFHWAGDAGDFQGESYIEVVCSPNNPDGFKNKAVLNSGGKTIHDLAYYWPQYTAIAEPADHDIMLFTVSKCTGHAGTRLGWAAVKDPNVAAKMSKFVENNTIGVSKDSQLRAAKILKVISDGCELPELSDSEVGFFADGRKALAERWKRLREVVKETRLFSLPKYPVEYCKFTGEEITTYPAFAWLKCEKEGIGGASEFLRSLKILTRDGRHFGVDAKYARVSMLDRDAVFDLFIERLASLDPGSRNENAGFLKDE